MNRLLKLQQENDRAGAEMLIETARFDRIRGEEPRAVSSFNLFQTPESIANKMVSLIPDRYDNPIILEPSAGLGNLYRAIHGRYGSAASYTLVENSPDCMGELYRQQLNAELLQRDFFEVSPVETGVFDVIIMNPPFKNGIDIKHINHALSFLDKDGLLVALCANGPRQNNQLKQLSDTWKVLPEKTFKNTGTNVSAVMLTISRKKTDYGTSNIS